MIDATFIIIIMMMDCLCLFIIMFTKLINHILINLILTWIARTAWTIVSISISSECSTYDVSFPPSLLLFFSLWPKKFVGPAFF